MAGHQVLIANGLTLTDVASGEMFSFPVPPDEIEARGGAVVTTFTLMLAGDVKIPSGARLTEYSWDGFFPGSPSRAPGVYMDFAPPTELVNTLVRYRDSNATLRLVVAQANLSDDVFIDSFTFRYAGGAGDIAYSITLMHRRPLVMRTIAPQPPPSVDDSGGGTGTSGGSGSGGTKQTGTVRLNNPNSHLNVRSGAGTSYSIVGKLNHGAKITILGKSGNWHKTPYGGKDRWVSASYVNVTTQPKPNSATQLVAMPMNALPSTYMVRENDTLFTIAKLLLGDGSRYGEIYALNSAAIDTANVGQPVDRYTVRPGLLLKIPTN
jgi:SH3 domain protein